MKIKSVLASAAACAIAVSAMAISASAADSTMLEGYGRSDEWGGYMDMVEMYANIAEVKTCEVTVKDGEFNGCVNISSESTSWGWAPVQTATANGDGTFTVVCPVTLAASDALVKIGVQDWNEGDGISTVTKVVLKDASGKVLFEKPESAPAETTTAPAAGDGATTTTTTTTTAAATTTTTAAGNNTGDAGVAVAVAGLALAGAAAFVARKKD